MDSNVTQESCWKIIYFCFIIYLFLPFFIDRRFDERIKYNLANIQIQFYVNRIISNQNFTGVIRIIELLGLH